MKGCYLEKVESTADFHCIDRHLVHGCYLKKALGLQTACIPNLGGYVGERGSEPAAANITKGHWCCRGLTRCGNKTSAPYTKAAPRAKPTATGTKAHSPLAP